MAVTVDFLFHGDLGAMLLDQNGFKPSSRRHTKTTAGAAVATQWKTLFKKDTVIFYCCGLQVVRQAVTVEMQVIVAALASAQIKMPLSSMS